MDQNFFKPEMLKNSAFLSGLPAPQLDWLIKNGKSISLEAGQILIEENVPQEAFYIITDGEFEIIRKAEEKEVVLAVQGSGQILGEMSAIVDVPPTATVRAFRPSKVLKINREIFNQLLLNNPSAGMSLLRTAMLRLRNTEVMLNQREKLASLGTLAAGLAHELNNPAAAARRSSGQLRHTINDWLNSRLGMDALNLDPRLNDITMTRLRSDIVRHDHHGLGIDPMTRSDRESEVENWLEEHGMDDAWEYAPILVTFDWTPALLEDWCSEFEAAQIPVILRWLATGYIVHSLVDEILHSTERISEIVTAVKSYAYLDEAPKKEIDIHDGLESTLVILKHKLKQGITLQRDYDLNLPRIEAYGSELNQVWTNLIDNAIDATDGAGLLCLRTYQQDDQVVVDIGDNGPGIPPSVEQHIFEPFFTTKGPSKGNGLGLHVSYNIIQKHRGKIVVKSQPGDTHFIVSLPIK